MKMKAPEGTTSAAVDDTQYEVDADGHIEIENGEHIPQLERHGFTQVAGETTHSEPEVDEIGPCPDFSRFVNRGALVDWLVAHGDDSHAAGESRTDLEAACAARHALVAAGEAQRIEPEAQETEQPEGGEGEGGEGGDPDATEE